MARESKTKWKQWPTNEQQPENVTTFRASCFSFSFFRRMGRGESRRANGKVFPPAWIERFPVRIVENRVHYLRVERSGTRKWRPAVAEFFSPRDSSMIRQRCTMRLTEID